jgi:hypothetical protein
MRDKIAQLFRTHLTKNDTKMPVISWSFLFFHNLWEVLHPTNHRHSTNKHNHNAQTHQNHGCARHCCARFTHRVSHISDLKTGGRDLNEPCTDQKRADIRVGCPPSLHRSSASRHDERLSVRAEGAVVHGDLKGVTQFTGASATLLANGIGAIRVDVTHLLGWGAWPV